MQENIFAPKLSETVHVEQMVSELIPSFLKNKQTDLQFIRSLLEEKKYDEIKKLGHNWKGACASYGFHYLSEVGKQFEDLADRKDDDNLKKLIDSLPIYLDNVKIEYYN